MPVNQISNDSSIETSSQIPSFSHKVHELISFRDEENLTDSQLREVVEAMLDQAVRSHSTISPMILATRFRADLENEGISMAA